MIYSKPHGKSGFTLVELVTAVAIILILSSVAIPIVDKFFANNQSAEAAARFMEDCLIDTYKTMSNDVSGYYHVVKLEDKEIYLSAFFNEVFDEQGMSDSGYGITKLSNNNSNNPDFINDNSGSNYILDRNNLPFFYQNDAQGIERCKIFYSVGFADKTETTLKCRDTGGKDYIVNLKSHPFKASCDGKEIELSMLNGNVPILKFLNLINEEN